MLSNAIFEATMLPVKRIDEISEWSGEAWFAPPEFIPILSPGVLSSDRGSRWDLGVPSTPAMCAPVVLTLDLPSHDFMSALGLVILQQADFFT